jgi:hypothetical protein
VLGSCVTCSACTLFIVRYTFLSAFVQDGREMPSKCVNSVDNFCYIYMQRNHICFKEACFNFGNKISVHFLHSARKVDQDKSWALHVCFMSFSS